MIFNIKSYIEKSKNIICIIKNDKKRISPEGTIPILVINKAITNNLDLLSFSFVLGGTIGNGFDRITKGYVIDFINLNFIDFPIFNIADISINIGLILIIYGFIKYKR